VCHDDADAPSASATYVFFLDYVDDVIYTMSYIYFLFMLSYNVYKIYRGPKSLLIRGHEGGEMKMAVSINVDC